MSAPQDPSGFSHELRVRYAECDAQGIVFNANWFAFFDVVMTEFWRSVLGGYQHLPEAFGLETVVAETGARFRGAGRFDDVLEFRVRIPRIGNSSMRAEIDALRDSELLVEGFIEYVFVDRATLQPSGIPDQIRDQLPAATS